MPTPRGGLNGALVESHPPDDRMAHVQCAGSVLETRGGCGCARVYGLFAREEEEGLAQIAERARSPAADLSEAEENSQGILDLVLDFGFLFTYAVLEHLRTAHHLPDGRFASRGALVPRVIFVYLKLFTPRPHSI
jgi:hypothetical protein